MLYAGHGKGKTTAAFGLAIRAVGSGMNVFVVQFIKGEWPSGERDFLDAFNDLRKKELASLIRLSGPDPESRNNHSTVPGSRVKHGMTTDGTNLGTIEVVAHGKGFVKILGDKKPFEVHQAAAREALEIARTALMSGQYQLVIMDEAISAMEAKLIETKDLLNILKDKPEYVHLVMTGHDAPKALVAKADLVSEVKMIKHPYYKGVLAQRGIDY